MDLFCFKSRKKAEQHTSKSLIVSWDQRYKKFLDFVIGEKAFDVSKILECGYFGASIIVKNDEKDIDLRVRILKEEYVGEEEKEWRKFNHRNLLPLLKIEYIKNADCYLFYSPVEETTLQEKIDAKLFRKDPLALWKLVNWLQEIGDATQYLHSCGYAHCNLEAKSMIITKDDVLQLSEFHNLSLIHRRTNRYGLPQSLRPPEAYFHNDGSWPVKADKLDSWSIGILILELFTGSYLSKKLTKKVCTWTKDVYPIIYDVLKKYTFSRLVSKAFPKAHGTVDLKSIRYLAAHALSPQSSKRPSVKDLHNLFLMMDIQKKFFSKIKMEFRKDFIWRNKIDQKRLQTYYSSMSIDDDLECIREDNLRKISDKRERNNSIRSVSKRERDSFTEDTLGKAVTENESGSIIATQKGDGPEINIAKEKCKKEETVLLKTPDKIKQTYTAFTFHDRSAYETSIFDIKSASSEISGVGLEKTRVTKYKMDEIQENMQNTKLHIGDALLKVEKIHKNLSKKKNKETQRKMKNQKEEKQLLENEVMFKDIFQKMNEKHDQENDYMKEKNIISTGNNETDVPKNDSKKIYSETEVSSEVEFIDENKDQDTNEGSKNIFSSGKRLINRFMKWSLDCYEMTTKNYEIRSSNNYLHSLSKQLTKQKTTK